MESKAKSRQLVLDSVEKTDAGEYTCEAGAEKLVFKIQVEGREGLFAVCPWLLCFWLQSLEFMATVCMPQYLPLAANFGVLEAFYDWTHV